MKEQLIEFPTAKLAKEKGFDWESSGLYDEKCILGINHHNYRRLFTNTKEDTYNIAAPTQSLLQKWLREIHNIEVVVTPLISNRLGFSFNNRIYEINIIYKNNRKNKRYSNIYEEALEIGLLEACKLIKK